MKRPPMLVRVQVDREEKSIKLWLPLFLLLPLALLLVIILSPLILIAVIILRATRPGRQLSPIVSTSLGIACSVRGIRAAWDVLCSMRGLRVDVRNRNERLYVSVI